MRTAGGEGPRAWLLLPGPRPAESGGPPAYPGGMNTVHLTDQELETARYAVSAYLRSFGHDQADTVARIRAVLARLEAAQPEPDPPTPLG